jgi:non-specific protein-tyrosine kinase
MKTKIKEAITFWNKKLSKNNEKPDIPEQDNLAKDTSRDKIAEKTGAEKYEKAILYFSQRRGNGNKPAPGTLKHHEDDATPDSSLHDVNEAPPAITPPAVPEVLPDEKLTEAVQAVLPETSLPDVPEVLIESGPVAQDVPEERSRTGWVSPQYTRSRSVQLNPAFLAENRCLAYHDNAPGAEAYRILRTQVLQRTSRSGQNTIMVTSALPGEGKTMTAINLAFSFAREFQHTVLLIDGDLRKQSVHKYLGFDSDKGLIDFLADGTPVPDLIVWPGVEKITLISGGRSFQESAEMLGSPRMTELIADMKGRYADRYIIFDVPPVLSGADALTLAPFIDQVLVVVQAGKTSMDDVRKAVQLLPQDKILGLVMNRHSSS